MIKDITVSELFQFYMDTLKKCGIYLLSAENKVIEYNIFEEFDIGLVSFFHKNSLLRLVSGGFINCEVMEKSLKLRCLVNQLQQSDDWNVGAVKKSSAWREVLDLTDKIKTLI